MADQDYSKLSIYEKILLVSNDIRSIEKDMLVKAGTTQYKAVSDLRVVLAVKDAETKYRLISIPTKQELVRHDQITKIDEKNNRTSITYVDIVKMTVKIVNLDNTNEFIEIESFGRGLDSGDKGFGKASTYARKYALLNAYKIATGEDPDQDPSQKENVLMEDDITKKVKDYLRKNDHTRNNVLQHFSIGSIDDLDKKHITSIYEKLKKDNRL